MWFGMFAAWLALFHFLGNSTLGYIGTHSLFGWMRYCYNNQPDDEHGFLIPCGCPGVVLVETTGVAGAGRGCVVAGASVRGWGPGPCT